ncbi:MAG TPA: hypothetical protein ENK66_02730 [Arcobacter sp.]|jgi:hypothetical protein|nr:hypothetical protein [Arcobacter sp.]
MNESIFLQKKRSYNNIGNNINIILSPEFYWVRVFDIPIESKKEALNSLPMLFEDFIDIDGYKFYIVKLEKYKYLGFAYNEENIKDIIKEAGIAVKKVQNIYFAQNEFSSLIQNDTPIIIENKNYLFKDQILVQLPESFQIDSADELKVSEIKLSSDYFILNNFSKYISNKMAISLSLVILILSSLVFIKTLSIKNDITLYGEKIEDIKTQNELPPSLFQTKSILETLQKSEKKYLEFRKVLSYGINFKNISKGELVSIDTIGKKIVFTYFKIDERKMKTHFSKEFKNVKFSKNKDKFIVEIINE